MLVKEMVEQANVGNIELNLQKQMRQQITERWDKLGFLDESEGHVRENLAQLFENQAKFILMQEASDATNSGSFETVVFPLIRRVYSKLLANDIVSVQAMNLSVGKLFYFRPVTSEREWLNADGSEYEEGDDLDGVTGSHKGLMGYNRMNPNYGKEGEEKTTPRYYLPDEVVNGKPEVVKFMETSLYDLFYDDYLFDQSRGKVTIHVSKGEDVQIVVFKGKKIVSASTEDVAEHADGTVRNLMLRVTGFQQAQAGRLLGPDGNEMDAETFIASMKVFADKDLGDIEAGESIRFNFVTQRYGKGIVEYNDICDARGAIYIELELAQPKDNTIDGWAGVAKADLADAKFSVAWAQYDSLELETEMGEVSFQLDSVVVSTKARKLRATWSPELSQDVAAFHQIDAEAELTALLSQQIGCEIDREVLRDLRKLAPWTLKWDWNGWKRQAKTSTNYTQKDWNQMLITVINQISAQIHKATLHGQANFIVVSTEVSAIFNDLEYFHVTDANAEADKYNMGIERIGSLNGRIQVYVDPYSPAESIIVGLKGSSLLDTGYIYAPYIPMALTPTIYNPFNFAPVKGIMTRYGKKCVNNKFYGHVTVLGLQKWNTSLLR